MSVRGSIFLSLLLSLLSLVSTQNQDEMGAGWIKIISTGRMSAISVSGKYVYGVGMDNNVWMYVMSERELHMIGIENKREPPPMEKVGCASGRWCRRSNGFPVISVAVSGDYVYGVSQKDKEVYKLRCGTKDEAICSTKWQKATNGSFTSIAISGSYIYGVGLNMAVYSHAFENGRDAFSSGRRRTVRRRRTRAGTVRRRTVRRRRTRAGSGRRRTVRRRRTYDVSARRRIARRRTTRAGSGRRRTVRRRRTYDVSAGRLIARRRTTRAGSGRRRTVRRRRTYDVSAGRRIARRSRTRYRIGRRRTVRRRRTYDVSARRRTVRRRRTRHSIWRKIFGGQVTSIAVRNNYVYGVGKDKHVYVIRIGKSKAWKNIINTGEVTDIAIQDNWLFGVGLDKQIWIHKL